MGPKSLAQIQALNRLSKPELDNYVWLWQKKAKDSRILAIDELDGMKLDTVNKIKELETSASTELDTYRKVWTQQFDTLQVDTEKQLGSVKDEWLRQMGIIRNSTETEFTTINANIQTNIKNSSWSDIGKQAMQNFADGISGYTINIKSAVDVVGESAIASLKKTLSGISDLINSSLNLTPVIRPVIDMTNVQDGIQQINGLFASNGLNVSSVNNKIPNLDSSNNSLINKNVSGTATSVVLTQNNYSPTPLSRLDIYRQTQNQISTLKGLVAFS